MRVGVLVSGSGRNLQALLDAEAGGALGRAEIVCVVSNQPAAYALERARGAGKPARIVDHRQFSGRQPFEAALLDALAEHRVELVVLAGFMRLLTGHFLSAYPDRVVNVHPALLPAFPGVDAQAQAVAHGVKISGCTVHLVDEGTDTGPILAQAAVPVLPDDDAAALSDRILVEELRLLPAVVARLSLGRLEREGRKAWIRE
jgi:phosphoribosylglycinamide formyltransferase-1